jgi:hypothetical protein
MHSRLHRFTVIQTFLETHHGQSIYLYTLHLDQPINKLSSLYTETTSVLNAVVSNAKFHTTVRIVRISGQLNLCYYGSSDKMQAKFPAKLCRRRELQRKLYVNYNTDLLHTLSVDRPLAATVLATAASHQLQAFRLG